MIRKFATGAALAAALLVPLTACSSSSDKTGSAAPKPSASPSPKPAEVLAAAVTKTRGVNVKYTLGDTTDTMSGAYDATKKIASMEGDSGGEKAQMIATENDLYLSGPADLQGRTLHMVIAKIPDTSNLLPATDPMAGLAMLSGVATATSPSANFFQGTLDLNKVASASPGAKKLVDSVVKAAGAKASEIQFNAKTTADGYVSEFSTTLPGVDAGKDVLYQLKLSDFGAPVTVAVPTTKVIEAPDEAYAAG